MKLSTLVGDKTVPMKVWKYYNSDNKYTVRLTDNI